MKSIAAVLKYEGLLLTAIGFLGLFMAYDMFLRFWFILLFGPVLLAAGLLMDLGSVGSLLRRRTTKYGANAILFTLVVTAVLVFVNVIAIGRNKTWDGTFAKVNTISAQTAKILQNLENPIMVTGFFASGEAGEFERLLNRYKEAAGKERFDYRLVDPDKHPEILQSYDVSRRGAIVVESEGRNNIIVMQSEEALTQSILKVTQTKGGPICFLTGHGEAAIGDTEESGASLLKRLLENENHDVAEIVLAGRPVREDCGCLVIAGPDRALSADEVEAVRRWAEAGGRLMFLSEVGVDSGLEDWMASLGVSFRRDVIVEPQMTLFYGSQLGVTPVVQDYPYHEITKDLNQPTMFQLARSLDLGVGREGVFISPLLRSSEEAWGETQVRRLLEEQLVEKDEDDHAGPLVLGAALEISAPSAATPDSPDQDPADQDQPDPDPAEPKKSEKAPEGGRIVVFGDSTFARNSLLGQLYNTNLVLNTIAWLTGKEEIISIRPNQFGSSPIFLSNEDRASVFFLSVVFIPMLVSVFGIGVIVMRNRRSNA